MARTVSIVGAGRIGKTLAKRLRSFGWRIGAVVARTPATARAAAQAIGAGSPHAMFAAPGLGRERASPDAPDPAVSVAVLSADVIFITTPDESMRYVVETLAHSGNRPGRQTWRGKIVLHTSGTLDRSVLAPLARLGASTGSLHPMQTFTGRGVPNLVGVTFATEGDARALRTARGIARALGGISVRIASVDKPIYHATAVLAAGSMFPLLEASIRMLAGIGFTRRRALQTLLPLSRQMLDNIERLGPRAAWTGPLSRGDYAVVAKHARALGRYPREVQQAYAVLAVLAGRTLAKDPKSAVKQIERALKNSRRNRT